MKEIIQRVERYCSTLDRHIPLHHYRKRCDKEVYINRLANKFFGGKYFKLTVADKTFYALFTKGTWKSTNGESGKSCGIEYSLGYKEFEIQVKFVSAVNLDPMCLILNYNSLIALKIEEIDSTKWMEVYNIFN
jgi:hypothetical protein